MDVKSILRGPTCAAAITLTLLACWAGPALAVDEVSLSEQELERLTSFEVHTLNKADKSFNSGKFRQASAEYDAFIMEFPRSKVLPYALMRKARSLHRDGKRFQAIKAYDEVLDYFPDVIKYAAASLYYQGLAHKENGKIDTAIKLWAEMANDEDYNQVPLAADALNELAEYFKKRKQYAKAIEKWEQVAKTFRKSNRDAANRAIDKVIPYYIRHKMDEPGLRKFYAAVKGFDDRPRTVPDDPREDRRYWEHVRWKVERNGNFNDIQKQEMQRYYAYWADQLKGRYPDWDDYQIDRIQYLHRAEDFDNQKYYERLDRQFSEHQKEGDFRRIIHWIKVYNRWHKDKAKEYYNKLNFAKMSNDEIYDLGRVLRDDLKDEKMALNALEKLRLGEMDDGRKARVMDYIRRFGSNAESLSKKIAQSFKNSDRGVMELVHSYYSWRNYDKAIELADQLTKSPDYASDAWWMKAESLVGKREYQKAILSYRNSSREPDKLWEISSCYAKMGKLQQAVSNLKEVENFYEKHRPEAALRIAYLYRDAGHRQDYVQSLRRVLTKYPKSSQSSRAHNDLEKLGERLDGGTDAD